MPKTEGVRGDLERLFAEAEQIFTDARDQLSREDYQKFLNEILASTEPES